MRALRFVNVAILSALVGSTALLYAQDEKQEDKPARQEDSKPQPKQDEAKPAHKDEAKPARPEQEKQDPKREDSRDQMKPEGQEHPAQQMEHARPETQEQGRPEQAQGARAAGEGGHIPDDKFRANFGNGHHFRAQGVIMQGQSRFEYGGYSFQLVDAWPMGWAYTDDCYIDYIDGEYFLFDLLHPGIRIAIVVVL
jgi:hypothetical protein